GALLASCTRRRRWGTKEHLGIDPVGSLRHLRLFAEHLRASETYASQSVGPTWTAFSWPSERLGDAAAHVDDRPRLPVYCASTARRRSLRRMGGFARAAPYAPRASLPACGRLRSPEAR